MEMTEGRESEVVVDNYWYMREDFKWRDDPNTAFIAYSSMLWKTERHTPWHPHDEAHDSDTLILQYPNGSQAKYTLDPPQSGVRIRDLTRDADAPQPVAWLLANEDQDPAHYQDFAPALRETNYPFRASYAVTVLESSVKTGVSLYEQGTDGEYADNIVAASTIRQDIPKAQSVDQFVRFKYRTTAYFPNR
jgi:glucan biosynthesis protein